MKRNNYNAHDMLETVHDILDEMRMDYSFALHNMGAKVGGYINRIDAAHKREIAEAIGDIKAKLQGYEKKEEK